MNHNKDLILIVDDQPNNLKVLSSVLSEKYSLSVAESGIRALSILDKMKPDLILLDIMMPEMDGYEVCERLKNNEDLKDIPVIFLTARTDIEDIVKGFEVGAVDYITKPFNFQELQVRVKTHLSFAHAKETIIVQKAELEKSNTQLLEAHNEMQKLNEDLIVAHDAVQEHAHKVNIINQKLLESEFKLRRANNELTKSNSEKDRFFSILAHDLKSPFSGLLGLLDMLNSDDDINEDERREMISALDSSAKNLYSLLENLLEWSRIKRDAIKYNPRNMKMAKPLKSILSLLQAQAEMKDISFENNIDEQHEFLADEMMVSTILRNLMTNAIKFTSPGGKIELSSSVTNDYFQICVSDNGVGMNEETLGKLFKIDEDITSLGTSSEKGTGLGLILCKEFAKIQGGNIEAESEPNKGSRFILSLPNSRHFI